MRNETDKEIQGFFDQLKEKDQKIQIPAFPEPANQRSINWWIPLGIAASLAVAAWLFPGNEPNQSLHKDVIIITLEEGKNHELQFKIERTSELESWESPTSSLLTEF
ncbi:hypothetical protein [Aquiflexum gelatinilyticum]|uniref:hypothetical protein n=1 Tax=Aquiflexum gelatinilyticum TaxID=2961943 RepID=UPI00216896E9|nr:hypothetical protein [Aquiflexum gelatinilyticum]MCS4435470.1 hypothetical protein [Aquiflexum gelatinilyticum]